MTRDEIKNAPEIVDFMLDESITADSRMKLHKRLEELCKLANKALDQEPILDKIIDDIQALRGCSCDNSDGIIDSIEDIIDKYKAETETAE